MPNNIAEALYYAVREDFNNYTTPGHIDSKNDNLIRSAIIYVEKHGWPENHAILNVEIESLRKCAERRGIELKDLKEWGILISG